MGFTRRRSDRPALARHRVGSSLECLEGRTLLSGASQQIPFRNNAFFQYNPGDLSVYNPINGQPVPYSVTHQLMSDHGPGQSLLSNEGKIVSGKDRAGNEWTITVHGPGYVIVTDTSPNDGILDDDIDTIQLVGTNIDRTYVTGNVNGSFRVQSSSTILFNRLLAQSGVNSVVLNGFSLGQTVTPQAGPNNVNTGIFLTGGVRTLEFHNIEAPIDTFTNDVAINVVIGDPANPLKVEPVIRLDHIFNTVFDSTATTPPTNVPQTNPTVNIIVNGQIRGLEIFSTTGATVSAGIQSLFPIVGTTGRTSVQATGIDHLKVGGAATNLTVARAAQPFQNGFSGLSRLRQAKFNGPTDGVGIDVNGPIQRLQFKKGLGNPTNLFLAQTATGQGIPATQYGIPSDQSGYAALGYVAGQVTATDIGTVDIGPANQVLRTATNPDFVQLYRQGNTTYYAEPGAAMTNSAIVSAGSIKRTHVVGDLVNSEIKSGFHYPSFAAGLEGTRAASKIGRVDQAGNQVNGVISATWRPFRNFYGIPGAVAGPGKITGKVTGSLVATGAITPLTNAGAGTYARVKAGQLAPPEAPLHKHDRRAR